MIAKTHERRVVITGAGLINPLGHDIPTVWDAIQNGRSGVGYTTIFDASRFPTRISAEVKNWDIEQCGEDPEFWKYRGRHTKIPGPLHIARCPSFSLRLKFESGIGWRRKS